MCGESENLVGGVALQAPDDVAVGQSPDSAAGEVGHGMVRGSRRRMRISTIRCRARLAWRSPPRDSRCRFVLPEEAGIGATPHRAANCAWVAIRCGLSPTGSSRVAGTRGPIPWVASRAGLSQRAICSSGTERTYHGRRRQADPGRFIPIEYETMMKPALTVAA